MTPILRALALGYAAPQILEFVSRAFPSLTSKIKKAKSSGYSTEQILSILNQGFGGGSGEVGTEASIQNQRDVQREQAGKDLLKLGAGSFATRALTSAIPEFVGSLKGALQPREMAPLEEIVQAGSPSPMPPNAPPLPPPLKPEQLIQAVQGQEPNQKQPVIQSPKQNAQQPPTFDSGAILAELGLDEKINNLLSQGQTPERITQDIVGSLKPKQKKEFTEMVRSGRATHMLGMVRDYAEKNKANIAVKPQKGNLVATPSGIGELESIRNKEGLVKDENGKLHKVKVDEMVRSPLPEKDLADLHEDLIAGIEKETGEEVSRMANWVGYDPNTNKLAFLPHIGSLYVYENISPEDKDILTQVLHQRKTTGENFIGAWKEGTKSPMGSQMSSLIRRLQAERGGKGSEYEGKFERVYDIYEVAKKASKEKKKKRKQ